MKLGVEKNFQNKLQKQIMKEILIHLYYSKI